MLDIFPSQVIAVRHGATGVSAVSRAGVIYGESSGRLVPLECRLPHPVAGDARFHGDRLVILASGRVGDLDIGRCSVAWDTPVESAYQVRYAEDGGCAAAWWGRGEVTLWQPKDHRRVGVSGVPGEPGAVSLGAGGVAVVCREGSPPAYWEGAGIVALGSDECSVAHVDTEGGTVVVVDREGRVDAWRIGSPPEWTEGWQLPPGEIAGVSVVPGRRQLLVARPQHPVGDRLELYGFASPDPSLVVIGTCWSWSPDGTEIAVGSLRGEVAVYSLASSQVKWSTKVHHGRVLALSWSPTGDRLISTSIDGTAWSHDT